MLTYVYTAREGTTGKRIQAEIEAEDERAAAKILLERGLSPLEIRLKGQRSGAFALLNRITTKQRVIFSRQLSTLINAGLPLVQSLEHVRGQTSNKALQVIIGKIITDVEAGSTLSDSMARHPKVFDTVYISLVAAGETSGTLDKSLERLADQQEKDAEIISKVRGAMIYPFIVILVMIGVVTFMLVTVLPQVQTLYSSLPGAELPIFTRMLLAVSNFLTHFWWLAIILLGFIVFLTTRWARTGPGKHAIDGAKMKMWPIGPLFMKLYMARFARTASTLVGSGVPMLKMLSTTSNAINNVHVEASINAAAEKVKGGKSLSEALAGDPNFLDLVPNMIKIGEQSGSLQDMLAKVADYYEKEVDNQIKAISTLVEPILMVVIGIVALVIVAAVLLPIYSLAGKNLVR
ncbi:MAG TPA: type II secretion system F family protein [Candidatus Saccharimonadales bacterium]|nr:type II secretion system F family protein [Candidatus Saccharimonadales bacterium]